MEDTAIPDRSSMRPWLYPSSSNNGLDHLAETAKASASSLLLLDLLLGSLARLRRVIDPETNGNMDC